MGAPRSTLKVFYDSRYRGSPGEPAPAAARLVRLPADRQEMTVKLASTAAGGRYLEIERARSVVMTAVIEHLVDPLAVLKTVRRILKPSGRLILCTPNIAKWTRRVKLLFGFFPSTASFREGLLRHDRKSPVTWHGLGKGPLARVWPALFSDIFLGARW